MVLYARGRVVTLAGPGPLDDEYAVEAWGDGQVLIRHQPSGSGRFLRLEQRAPAVVPGADAGETPQD